MENLTNRIKELSLVNVEGTQYLAKIEKIENGIKLVEAVPAVSRFDDSISNWIKAANLNQLESITTEGMGATFSKKEFSEQQLMEIDIIAAKAEYAIKYAVADLQNSKF